MGQKVHPTGFRIAHDRALALALVCEQEELLRASCLRTTRSVDHIHKEYGSAGIPRIEIERTGEAVNVIIYTARPGVLVGRKGVRVDQLKKSCRRSPA